MSIVLPTHNRYADLQSAVESIVAQSLTDWELIIIDDASEEPVENRFGDDRIQVIRHEENLKLPRALNAGFEHARGLFWTWTSDDNWYRPQALEQMARTLDANPSIGLVYAGASIVNSHREFIRAWPARRVEESPILPWCGACFLYRRELATQVGEYRHDAFLAEDLDYWIRARIAWPMLALSEDLYEYREHDQSLSASRSEEARQQSARVVEIHWDHLTWLTKRTRGETALGLAEAAWRRQDRAALRRWLGIAMRGCPGLVIRNFKRGLLASIGLIKLT